jgi:hypothetical protein
MVDAPQQRSFPTHLLTYLQATFTPERMQAAFQRNEDGTWPEVIVFGEGYGEKIQNGHRYRRVSQYAYRRNWSAIGG